MKSIRIFIASSDELKEERNVFAALIGHLNKLFKPRGFEIDPELWEWLDASMGPKRKQEEYNEVIKTCDICLVLFWTKFGDYTAEELNTAYHELCAGRKPTKIYVYFKEGTPITPELQKFKESFDNVYGHFYCRFENTDTLNLNFVLQLERFYNDTIDKTPLLQMRNSKVEIDGTPIADLKEIPFAGNNPEYLQTLKEIEKAQAKVLKYPDDPDFRQDLHDLQERRKQMEESLLDTAKLITRLLYETSSARLQEAIRLFEAGDNKGANAVLNLKEISEDAAANARRIDQARAIERDSIRALETNIEEFLLKIKALQNAMAPGWVSEVIAIYSSAVEHARGRIAPEKFVELLRDNADFLNENKQYHLVGSLYEEALTIFRELAQTNPAYKEDVAVTLNNLAILHKNLQQYDRAEREYLEALEISRRLAEKNTQAHEEDVADTLNNLANLHQILKNYIQAEQEYLEALEIYRRLAEQNPKAFDADVAQTLSNLALLHNDLRQYDCAEQECLEALKILRRLTKKNPQAFEKHVADSLNNLAILHNDLQQYDCAEREYLEALEIRHRLAEKNPLAFEDDVATTLNNLASLHDDLRQYDCAEREYLEALEILRRLAKKNPQAFDANVAHTLNNLAVLHSDLQQYDCAAREYQEALNIRRRLAEQNPQAFDVDVANTLNNLANLYSDLQQYDCAEREYSKALEVYRRLAKRNPQAFDADAANTLNNLAILHSGLQQYDCAEREYLEALEVHRRLAEQNPQIFDIIVANTLYNLGILFIKRNDLNRTKLYFTEALQVYRRVVIYNPSVQQHIVTLEKYLQQIN